MWCDQSLHLQFIAIMKDLSPYWRELMIYVCMSAGGHDPQNLCEQAP